MSKTLRAHMLIGTMAELIETPANAGVSMYVVAKVFDK